ncbi:hypothetical protein Micbo1qcDRAFT_196354 [Microdochium bolleyi]|uniref:Calcineurin-like phosphoesterase domain-containing protein n=1 Tax=Microdochium bolleyi TaxID=196109 RepID=A0A136IZ52_9PEZI|nr:hypothetical protein Micbo1qcDRAFT_196354 [Microdochium bolleyi]
MPSFQVVSDLHLESPKAYDIFEIEPRAPYLALLGDIGYIKHKEEYLGFILKHLRLFRIVFLILGNHEPWHSNWDDSKAVMREFEKTNHEERAKDAKLGQFVFLDRSSYCFHDETNGPVTVLGCTLFSRVPEYSMQDVSLGVKDFYNIDSWTVEEHSSTFEQDLAWLNNEVQSLQGAGHKVVIFTHHSPTLDKRALDPRHKDSPIISGFATDLSAQPCRTSSSVKLWAFGHNHYNCDFVDEKTGTRLITNQRGYYFKQSENWDAEKVIVVN